MGLQVYPDIAESIILFHFKTLFHMSLISEVLWQNINQNNWEISHNSGMKNMQVQFHATVCIYILISLFIF